MKIEELLNVEMVDLGVVQDAAFSGVWSPKDEVGKIGSGVTSQFLDDADVYHSRYFDSDYAKWQISTAISKLNYKQDVKLILDVGSGSGPSVIALLEIFPEAHVVATDISPNLLAILRQLLDVSGKGGRCTTACLDLNQPWFKGQPFDLVVGAAILHHLFEPDKLIEQVFRSLKPQAPMIFFEPFEPGNAVVTMFYRLLLERSSESFPLAPKHSEFFAKKIVQMGEMRCEVKDRIAYAEIDDKWAFTRTYFQLIADNIRASQLIVYPIDNSDKPIRNKIKTDLRLAKGWAESEMPDWVWNYVDILEAAISPICREEFLVEGCVAFIK